MWPKPPPLHRYPANFPASAEAAPTRLNGPLGLNA
nr:MAG TPA: hypothetical protein [Caudoviricetes sp.]